MAITLNEQRALLRAEKAKETADLWAAILALSERVDKLAMGEHIRKAQGNLMRAGVINSGDLPDTDIAEIADAGGSRAWSASMGAVYINETVSYKGLLYICLQAHNAQADWQPGKVPALFRPIRTEPENESDALEFIWGELVPFGAVRRDPVNDKLYTPVKSGGVTLYEPHYPHMVPGEYAVVDDGNGGKNEPEEWKQPTGAHDAYPKGAEVIYNGSTYTSDVDANVWEPSVYGWTMKG